MYRISLPEISAVGLVVKLARRLRGFSQIFSAKIYGASLFLLLLSISLQAQTSKSSYSLYKNIPVEAHFITTDKLQQFYLINEQNDLIKYNPAGIEVFRYSNNKLGDLKSVDVSNPFHILLYYPEFGSLITLDRTLNETSRHNLIDMGVIQTQAVGISFDNNIWVYDELEYRLRKYNKQGEVLVESPNMANISSAIHPVSVQENNNLIYLHDPDNGILIFDIFGQYLKTLSLKNLTVFQIRNGHLLGLQNQEFYIWQLDTGIKHPINLPIKPEEGIQLRLEQNCLFTLFKNEVKIYRKK